MKTGTLGLVIAAIVAGFGAIGWVISIWDTGHETLSKAAVTEALAIKSEFELVDQTGRAVHDEDFPGKWQLVFFGFTSCPDVCPTTLGTVTAALKKLGPAAQKLQPLLITVDPERDTPSVLKDYLTPFDPRILGLTGTPEQIQAASRSFRVYASKQPLEGNNYTMDHSSFIYLMDPKGEYVTHFETQTPIDEMVSEIRKRLAENDASQRKEH